MTSVVIWSLNPALRTIHICAASHLALQSFSSTQIGTVASSSARLACNSGDGVVEQLASSSGRQMATAKLLNLNILISLLFIFDVKLKPNTSNTGGAERRPRALTCYTFCMPKECAITLSFHFKRNFVLFALFNTS